MERMVRKMKLLRKVVRPQVVATQLRDWQRYLHSEAIGVCDNARSQGITIHSACASPILPAPEQVIEPFVSNTWVGWASNCGASSGRDA